MSSISDVLLYKSKIDVNKAFPFPTINEVILYVLILILFIIICVLFHNNTITLLVNNKSRCVLERKNKDKNDYIITGFNDNNMPLYSLLYNLDKKEYKTSCACNPGQAVIKFPSIKQYNYAHMSDSTKPAVLDTILPDCNCDNGLYTEGTQIVRRYLGTNGNEGGLIDFIESNGKLDYFFTGVTDNTRCNTA